MKKMACLLAIMLSLSGCSTPEARERWVIAGAALAVGALAYQAGKGGGGGGYAAPTDYDWDWDQYYNQYYQLVWMCRGVQTTQFADAWRCSGKPQTDLRWPNK